MGRMSRRPCGLCNLHRINEAVESSATVETPLRNDIALCHDVLPFESDRARHGKRKIDNVFITAVYAQDLTPGRFL